MLIPLYILGFVWRNRTSRNCAAHSSSANADHASGDRDAAKVEFGVIYGFYQARSAIVESIEDFGHDDASRMEIGRGMLGGGQKWQQRENRALLFSLVAFSPRLRPSPGARRR
jgi:hypothetical protein